MNDIDYQTRMSQDLAPSSFGSEQQPAQGNIDMGKAFGIVFEDPNWVKKILIGSIWSILSIFVIGSFMLAGYAYRLVQRAARGEQQPLPEWDDFGGLFLDGVKTIVVYVIYIVPLVFVLVIPMLLLSTTSASPSGSNGPTPTALTGAMGWAALWLVLMLCLLIYLPAAYCRMATTDRFGAAFEIGENIRFVRRNLANYLLTILLYLLTGTLAQFGIVLCFVGVLPASFWSMCVTAWALGQTASRDRSSADSRYIQSNFGSQGF